jgi:syntaxin 1B/2/3
MSGLRPQDQVTNGGGAGSSDGMTRFYNQVSSSQTFISIVCHILFVFIKVSNIQDELRRFDTNVSRIADLQNRSLNNTDEALSQQNAAALDELVEETRALSNQIKNQIQDLEKESLPPGQDPRIRRNQASRTVRGCVYVFAQTFGRRPPSSVQNLSKRCRTISR